MNMEHINTNAAKEQLRSLIQNYSRPLRGKLGVLAQLREEILELSKKGATSAEIAAMLAQCQVNLSKDSVARFLRMEAAKERSTRTKKTATAPQAPTTDGAPAKPFAPRFTSLEQQ
jgi:septum formation topological specificity factor MinE